MGLRVLRNYKIILYSFLDLETGLQALPTFVVVVGVLVVVRF